MKIGLIDVDGHRFPNLCLMKLSAYHKARGDMVEWYDSTKWYDLVYMSRVFTDTYSKDYAGSVKAYHVIKGGTGYGLDNKLPDAIEHTHPDMGCTRSLQAQPTVSFPEDAPVDADSALSGRRREERRKRWLTCPNFGAGKKKSSSLMQTS